MTITICSAPRHGARYAYANPRCNCPAAINRRNSYQRAARREYIPGRADNRRGPRFGVDEIAVERAVGGDRSLRLSVEERRAAIDQLDLLGLAAAETARRLSITVRTVQRQRARRAAQSRQEVPAA